MKLMRSCLLACVKVSVSLIYLGFFTLALRAGIAPTALEVNLGPLPVDLYNGSSLNSGSLVSACPTTYTIRSCYMRMINNNPSLGAVLPGNYVSQGVTGVRFQLGLGGGEQHTIRRVWTEPWVYK